MNLERGEPGRTGAQRLSPSGRRKGELDVRFRILSTGTLLDMMIPLSAAGLGL